MSRTPHTKQTEPPETVAPRKTPKRRKCLIGLHTRTNGTMQSADWQAAGIAHIEALKLMTLNDPADVDRARALFGEDLLIVCRVFETFAGRTISPLEFVNNHGGIIQAFYNRGVRYFELHNEPNLVAEGWGSSWADGKQFSDWFVEVVRLLDRTNLYPEAKWGYPGLSPGNDVPGLRYHSERWLEQSAEALALADWVGIHCYWIDAATMNQIHAGKYWTYYPAITNKPLMITECNNSNPDVTEEEQAMQALSYYKQLRDKPVMAAFWFAVSGTTPEWRGMYWREEDGRMRQIVGALGGRSF